MNSPASVFAVIEAMETLSIPYMLVGSLSSSFYGVGRSTKDADVVVEIKDSDLARLVDRLKPVLKFDPQIRFETVTGTTKYEFQSTSSDFVVEIFQVSEDPHDRERFSRRRRGLFGDRQTFWPSVEDVIVTKLRWAKGGKRQKDVDDVKIVVATQGDAIDWVYVYSWCDRHGTREILDKIRASIPPL